MAEPHRKETRMKTSRVASLPLLLLAAACASRPSGPPALDPAGNYEFTSSVDGL
jgi:hypothetical protein